MLLIEFHLPRVFGQKQSFYVLNSSCFIICVIRSRTSSIVISKPASRQSFPKACLDLNPPQMENPWLHDESKKVLESFQSGIESPCMSWVLSAAHEIIQHFGQLSAKEEKTWHSDAITHNCFLYQYRWHGWRCLWGTGESKGLWGMARWEINVAEVRGCTTRILTGTPKSHWSVCQCTSPEPG